MDKKNKKKVLIKRISKKKTVTNKKSKLLAGLGLGATLAGFGGGGAAGKANNIKPVVRVQTKNDNSKTGKLKKILNDTFGVPEAKAWYTDGSASSDPFYGSGGGYWYGTPGSSYTPTGSGGGGGYVSPLSFTTETNTPTYSNSASDALHNLMDQADAQAQAQNNQTGSGETEEEGSALPGGVSEGANEGSGEGGDAGSGMVSAELPFLQDTEPISIPIAPSDNYTQMYNTPPPEEQPAETSSQTAPDAPTSTSSNYNYDPVDNTTGGQYGSYNANDPQTPDLQNQSNPAVVDGTAGMFGQGSGLDASGNAVFAPSSDNNLDSVWQNVTGQNFTDTSGFGGNWNNVKEVADQVSADGKSVIIHVVNDQGDRYVNYTYDDWLAGKTPSEITAAPSVSSNLNYDSVDNTTGGQYGTYPSAASFFADPSAQEASVQANPEIVDGTAGMFGPGSGLDSSGNQVAAPQPDNNWDSVWQNTTGQNPNTAISPSTAYGGGSSWEQAVLQSGGSVGDSYIVVNNQPYTRQQWESGLLPGEQGPVSPSVTPESPFVNIVSDAVPIEYSPATYDYLGNRTDTQKAPAVNQEITNPFSLGQPGLGDAVAVLPTAETAATASAVKTQSASAEEFFTKPNVLTEAELSQQFQGEGAGYEDSLESRSAGLKNEPEYSNVNLFAEKPTATSAGLPFTSWNGNVGVDASGKQWILEADGSLKDASNLIVEPTTSLPLLFIYPTLEFTDTLTEKSGTIKIDGRLAFISMTEDGGYKVGVGADDPNPKYYTAEDFYKLVAKQIPQTNGISRLSSLMVDDVFSGEKFSSKVLDWFTMTLDDGKQVIVQPQRDGTFKIGDAGGSEKPEILSYKEFLDWLPTSYQNNRYLLNKSPDVVPVGAVQEFVTKSGDRVLVTKVEENNYTIITNPQTAEQQKKIGLSLDEVKNIVVMPEYAYASSSFSDSSNKKYSSDANQDLVTSSSRSIGQGQTETSSVGQNFTPTWLKDAAPSEAAVLEDPGIVNMDSQIQGSDESKIKTADSDSIAKKGVIDNAKSGLLKVGQALGGLSGVKSTKSAATAAAPAASEDMVVPDKTIKVGKKSVDVYNLGTDQNPIWTDFEGNLYKASGKSMVVVGSTKYEVLKDAQGQPMNLNTMSVLDISKVWSQGNNGSLDVDKGLWQNILSAGKAAGNQVKNNKTISAVGGVYTVGGVGAYGATKEVIKQVKDKTANDYLGMIYNWAWPQDWESGGAKVVTASGQEPVLKIAGKEIPRSQVQNMTTAQLTDLVNQKINGPNKP